MKRTIFGLFLLSCTLRCLSAEIQLSFDNFPYIDQLPSNSVRRIYQDKEGYLWLGTLDGICRYDAYQIKIFRSDMNNPSLLTDNDIMSITEDNENHIWIGTRQGINILDKRTLQIKPFEEQGIAGDNISCLLCDDEGNIWIASSSGLHRYDVSQKLFKTYWADPSDSKTVPSSAVTNICKDLDGTLWFMFWNGGICRYLPEYDNFERFPYVGIQNNPFRLYQDKDHNYWLCTWGDGLYKFDPMAEGKDVYRHISIKNKVNDTEEVTFFSIVQDNHNGYLWLMSLNDLYVLDYDAQTQQMRQIDISSQLSGFSKVFSEVVKDKDDNLWIASFGDGPICVNFDKPLIRNYDFEILRHKLASSFSIISIMEEEDGLLWMALNRVGLCQYNPHTNQVRLNEEITDVSAISEITTLNAIYGLRSRRECWLTTNDHYAYILKRKGSGRYDISSIDLKVHPGYDYFNKKVMCEDKQGNVWVGLSKGLLKVSSQGEVQAIAAIPAVSGMVEDRLGCLWVSSEQEGLYRLSEGHDGYEMKHFDKYTEGLNTSNIQHICVVNYGSGREKIWIGTKYGRLITYDYQQDRFDDVSHQCAMSGEGILNILSDDDYNVWISTNKRIAHYNTQSATVTNYSVSDHLAVNSFVSGSCYKNYSGAVFFGGNKGLCVFNAGKNPMINKNRPIKILINDVKVQNQSVFDNPDQTAYDILNKSIVLQPDEKNVEVSFTTLNYSYARKIQYAYKLDGVDDSWNYVNNRHFANYNNLKAGKYTLSIMAADENGRWNDDIEKIEIIKRPGLYQSWWAILLYVTGSIMMVVMLYFYLYKRIRLGEALKIARIDKEKSEDLTQTKLRYFTNVSHELLTPLTVISCMIDDMENTMPKKSQWEVIKENITRLKRLLQQILDFRKVESGAMKLKVLPMDLSSFVHRICQFNFLPLAGEKDIRFDIELPDYAMNAWFDSEKMDIILFNLLSNAFKYTPNGGTVKLNLSCLVRDGRRVAQLVVCDTGAGISQEHLKHIFTRFYSNDPTHSVENHGIGLTLTKELIEMHHGCIKVESELGIGSTFAIEFPMDKEAYTREERVDTDTRLGDAEMISSVESVSDEYDEKTMKEDIHLLIVEDNAQLRTLISRIFGRYYHVYTAENGKEAIAVLNENAIDIVVSDIIMPEMDGLELCRTIKNNIDTSHIEVLLLTAKNSINDRIECYNAGASGYLSKPFELKVLEAKIKSMIKNRKHKTAKFTDNTELNISSLKYTSMDEIFLKNAVDVIEEHLSEPNFDLDVFSDRLNMSKSSLYRKLKSLSGLSPVEFTKSIRLKHACQMLAHQTGTISDIAYAVGFSDPKYFTSCFKAAFKVTPTEYVKQQKQLETSE